MPLKLPFIFTTLFLAAAGRAVFAQGVQCDSVYELAEVMPVYEKGQKEFFNYLNKNLEVKKPCKATELKRIIFIVNKEGKISDIEMIGVHEKCKQDLVRQFQAFPDWKPGSQQGQPVCVRVILPIQLKERAKVNEQE